MSARPLAAILLLAAFAARADERVLRADGSELRVDVVEVSDPAREAMLQRWIADTAAAPLTVFGRFPLRSAQVRVKQVDENDDSPVPWGQTLRSDGVVSVLLFVREDATLDELRGDWTAVHELSHLFHPYLGSSGRWMAEGLASYYQNVLRARAGLLEPDEAWRRLEGGFQRGRRARSGMRLDQLRVRGDQTMRLYWAGAAYWLEADLALRAHGGSLDAALAEYSRCCLGDGTALVEPEAFAAALDRIAKQDAFVPLYRRYAASETFPSLDAAYRQLGIRSVDGRLQFSRGDAGAKLRAAIAGRRDPPKPQTSSAK